MKEIYISIDVETTGPIPSEYSMYQLGACMVGKFDVLFFKEIKLLNENFEQSALDSCKVTIEELKNKGEDPIIVMDSFDSWIKEAIGNCRPVFIGFNATFDWMFLHWYFIKFLKKNPFGISGLDIKAYYMGMMNKKWGDTTKREIKKKMHLSLPHTHNALSDAIEQAEIFEKLLEKNDDIRRKLRNALILKAAS
ncbi:MAG: exonuclease domain-containing protein [Patescibacteria group bacterium]|nr:exonuclease domain-containing protein [Patescibacteria group bacterium]